MKQGLKDGQNMKIKPKIGQRWLFCGESTYITEIISFSKEKGQRNDRATMKVVSVPGVGGNILLGEVYKSPRFPNKYWTLLPGQEKSE